MKSPITTGLFFYQDVESYIFNYPAQYEYELLRYPEIEDFFFVTFGTMVS